MTKLNVYDEVENVKRQLLEYGLIDYNESLFAEVVNNDISKVVSDHKLLKNAYKAYLKKIFNTRLFGKIFVSNYDLKTFEDIKRKLIYLENYFIHNIGKEEFIQFCKGFSLVYGDVGTKKKLGLNELDKFYYYCFRWSELSDKYGDLSIEKDNVLTKIVFIQKKILNLGKLINKQGFWDKLGFRIITDKSSNLINIRLVKLEGDPDKVELEEKIKVLNLKLENDTQKLEAIRKKITKLKNLGQKFNLNKINMNDKILFKLLINIQNLDILIGTNKDFASIVEQKYGIDLIEGKEADQMNTKTIKMLDELVKNDKMMGRKSIEEVITNASC